MWSDEWPPYSVHHQAISSTPLPSLLLSYHHYHYQYCKTTIILFRHESSSFRLFLHPSSHNYYERTLKPSDNTLSGTPLLSNNALIALVLATSNAVFPSYSSHHNNTNNITITVLTILIISSPSPHKQHHTTHNKYHHITYFILISYISTMG